jgi:ribonucleotide monophosphatase NagD (HAD superfamily)
MKPAMAFDATGVLFKSNKLIPKAKEALTLLKDRDIPFVILTNAGGRTETARA